MMFQPTLLHGLFPASFLVACGRAMCASQPLLHGLFPASFLVALGRAMCASQPLVACGRAMVARQGFFSEGQATFQW